MLKPKQNKALELIMLGLSNIEIARKLAVGRSTIARWRKEEAFTLKLENEMSELKERVNEKLLFLANQSLGVLEEALEKGNTRVALTLIRRFDENQKSEKEKMANLPRLNITIQEPEHNYTVGIEEMMAHNKALPEPDKDLIELGERLRRESL